MLKIFSESALFSSAVTRVRLLRHVMQNWLSFGCVHVEFIRFVRCRSELFSPLVIDSIKCQGKAMPDFSGGSPVILAASVRCRAVIFERRTSGYMSRFFLRFPVYLCRVVCAV